MLPADEPVTILGMIPSKMSYVGLWLWDSAMHALAYRHLDPDLARNQIRSMLAHQLADGMLPDAIYDEGVIANMEYPVIAEVTKPPIVAWAALKLQESDPDPKFLEQIYIPLVRWNAWWFAMNDDDAEAGEKANFRHPLCPRPRRSYAWRSYNLAKQTLRRRLDSLETNKK